MGLDGVNDGMLPGMEVFSAAVEDWTEPQLRRLPVHTAEGLLKEDQDKYVLAARLFFNFGLPVRSICSMLRLSPHTLAAIITRENATKRAEEWRGEFRAKLATNLMMASAALTDLLGDSRQVAKAGIVGLSQAVDRLTRAMQQADERAAKQEAPEASGNPVVNIAAAIYAAGLKAPPPAQEWIGVEEKKDSVATVLEEGKK